MASDSPPPENRAAQLICRYLGEQSFRQSQMKRLCFTAISSNIALACQQIEGHVNHKA